MIKKSSRDSKNYDLGERTFKFSQDLIRLCRKVKQDHITKSMVSQLIRAGTSIGANYCEADSANSKKDFINKISISKKEANETKYWIYLLKDSYGQLKPQCEELLKEIAEIGNMLGASVLTLKGKKKF